MAALDPRTPHPSLALERVARALRVPVAEFLGEPAGGETGDLLALMRLWSEIEDDQGRSRVLDIARQAAGRSGYKDCA